MIQGRFIRNQETAASMWLARNETRMYIQCGRCHGTSTHKIYVVDNPVVVCPCGTPNIIKVHWV